MNKFKNLEKAVLAVMLGQKEEQLDEAKKPLHPNQQKLDVHEPEKDELTAKDFEMLRKGKKVNEAEMKDMEDEEEEDDEDEDEDDDKKKGMKESRLSEEDEDNVTAKVAGHKVTLHRGSTTDDSSTYTLHHPSGPKKVTIGDKHRDASGEISGEKVNKAFGLESGHKLGHKIAGSMNGMGGISKFQESVELDLEADETVIVHNAFEYEVKESYTFGDYLSTAKKLVGEEAAIELANKAFKDQDISIFVEEFTRSDIQDKIKAHEKAGHKVSMPKYSTKSGKPHAEYIVTDKDSGVRRKYIHHGNMRSVENMGTVGKKDE